jgi:hypothetical protein
MIYLADIVIQRNVGYKTKEYLLLKMPKNQRLKERLMYNYKLIYERVEVVQSKASRKNAIVDITDSFVHLAILVHTKASIGRYQHQ